MTDSQRLVYTPRAYVFIKDRDNKIHDLTRYVVSGSVNRLIDQVSTAEISFRNPHSLFTVHYEKGETPDAIGGVVPATFSPMDPITIYMRRQKNFPVRVFTGFLDKAPYLQLYPGVVTVKASCTLKRLMYTFFDPALPYTQSFLYQFGWLPTGNGQWISTTGLQEWATPGTVSQNNTANTSAGVTKQNIGTASKDVFLVGDSIAEGVKKSLGTSLGKDYSIVSNTIIGRSTQAGIDAIKARIKTAHLPSTVVVALGSNDDATNPSGFSAKIKEVMKLAGTQIHVIWIDLHGTNQTGSLVPLNNILTAAATTYPNLTVIPWAKYIDDHSIKVDTAQGIHPDTKGYQALAGLISTEVTGGAQGGTKGNPFKSPDSVDGSLSQLLFATMQYIGNWDPTTLYIESMPQGIFDRMAELGGSFAADNAEAKKEFSDLLRQIGGTSAGSPDGKSATADLSGINGDVPEIVYQVGVRLKASPKLLLAAMETGLVEAPIGKNNTSFGNPIGGDGADPKTGKLLPGFTAKNQSAGWRQETVASYPNVDRRDVNASAKRFFEEGFAIMKGGSYQASWTAGQLAAAIQRPRADLVGKYDLVHDTAVALLNKVKAKVDSGNSTVTGVSGSNVLGGSAFPATNPAVSTGSPAAFAEQALKEKSKYVYSEGPDRSNKNTLFGPAPRTMDCSSFVTLCYKEAGFPDPNGANYKPIGYTGTLLPNCNKVKTPEVNDLCFYGGTATVPGHVTIYVGNGDVISMGHQGDPHKGPAETTGPAPFHGYYRPKNSTGATNTKPAPEPKIDLNYPLSVGSRLGATPSIIVLHSTEGSNSPGLGDLRALGDGFVADGLSVHVATDAEGNSARYVADDGDAQHVAGFNNVALGIEQVGHAVQKSWPDKQYAASASWIAYWSDKFKIPLQRGEVQGGKVTKPGIVTHKQLGTIGGGHIDPGDGYKVDHVIQIASTLVKGGSASSTDSTNIAGNTTSDVISQGAAGAFFASIDLPSAYDAASASMLKGDKSLLNDKPLLPFIQQLCSASLRHFQSLPDGRFYAFFPDYFGEFNQHPPYWTIDDIEILDGKVELTDENLVTHMYVVGDTVSPMANGSTPEPLRAVASSGVVTVFNAFMSDKLLDRGGARAREKQAANRAKKKHPDNSLENPSGMGILLDRNEAAEFLGRYGARPVVEDMPMIKSNYFEFFLAYQKFLLGWSQQFSTNFTFTFMPELFPGGKVGFPNHGLQMYIEQVTHSFDYESGFMTTASLSAPSTYGNSAALLPPNMVQAILTTGSAASTPDAVATPTKPKGTKDSPTAPKGGK